MLHILFPRRLCRLMLLALPLGIVFALGDGPNGDLVPALQDLLFLKFYPAGQPNPSALLGIMVGLIPLLLGIFLLCNYFVSDLSNSSVYLFTRIRHRSAWYLAKLCAIVLYAGTYSALYMAGGILSFAIRGMAWTWNEETAGALAAAYGLLLLLLVLCSFSVNILSLLIPANFSFLAMFLFLLGGTSLSCLTYREETLWLFRLSPISHYWYVWHSPELPLWQSFLYFSVLILLVSLLGLWLFSHLDLSLEDLENR